MDRERLDLWCERGILGLVLGILVYAPLATGAVRPLEMLVIQGLTVLILLLWTVRLWTRENHRFLAAPICWFVLAFAIYATVRYNQADLEYVARGEFLKVLVYTVIFFAILDNLNRQESTQILCFALIAVGAVISMYAVYQFVTASKFVWHFVKPEQYGRRGSGTFICPNNLAGYLDLVLPLALAFTFMGRFKPLTKVFFGYAAIAMLAGMAATLSKGGWIASGLALIVFFVFLLKQRNTRLPAAISLVLLALAAGIFVKQQFATQHRWKQLFKEVGVEDSRFYIWQPALQMWNDNIWTGVGPAHFDYRFPAYRPEIIQMRPGRVHNDYLNTLVDWGVIGATIVAGAFIILAWGVFKTWKFVRRTNDLASKPSSRGAFVIGAAIGLLALLIHSAGDFNMHIPANALVAVALMAMLTGYLRFATEAFWVRQNWILGVLATLACIGAGFYLATETLRGVREYVALTRAETLERQARKLTAELSKALDAEDRVDWTEVEKLSSELAGARKEQITALKSAHSADPKNFDTVHKIGETLRTLAWGQGAGSKPLMTEAMEWFLLASNLNPFDGYNPMRYGMCMHGVGKRAEAESYFKKAVDLDPKNYYVVAHLGWHFFELGNYRDAREWFDRSTKLSDWRANPIAWSHLALLEKLPKKASENQ